MEIELLLPGMAKNIIFCMEGNMRFEIEST